MGDRERFLAMMQAYEGVLSAARIRLAKASSGSTTPGARAPSSLVALDVSPRVAMRILRHSQIAMTMEVYSEVPTAKTRSALKRLGRQMPTQRSNSALDLSGAEGFEPLTRP
jgi:hypothetical protein